MRLRRKISGKETSTTSKTRLPESSPAAPRSEAAVRVGASGRGRPADRPVNSRLAVEEANGRSAPCLAAHRGTSGGGGIRTLGTGSYPSTVFETAPFNHSGTPPSSASGTRRGRLAARLAHLRLSAAGGTLGLALGRNWTCATSRSSDCWHSVFWPAVSPAADGAAPVTAAAAPPRTRPRKKCRKGYRLKTVKKKVRRHGRRVTIRVKRCRKVKRPNRADRPRSSRPRAAGSTASRRAASSSATSPTRASPTAPPAGPTAPWRSATATSTTGPSTTAGSRPSAGSDIRFSSGYTVTGAIVNADGSWAFDETVPSGGNPSYYSWRVSKSGVATGGYLGPDGSQQPLGPLQWVREARDCSY